MRERGLQVVDILRLVRNMIGASFSLHTVFLYVSPKIGRYYHPFSFPVTIRLVSDAANNEKIRALFKAMRFSFVRPPLPIHTDEDETLEIAHRTDPASRFAVQSQ